MYKVQILRIQRERRDLLWTNCLAKIILFFLDGALGTMLQSAGMPAGILPEVYALEHPEITENIHRAYVQAGSRIVYTNTFSSNAHKLIGSGHSVEEIVSAAVRTAKAAAGGKALVALDIGPIGEMMEPAGTLTFDDALLFIPRNTHSWGKGRSRSCSV